MCNYLKKGCPIAYHNKKPRLVLNRGLYELIHWYIQYSFSLAIWIWRILIHLFLHLFILIFTATFFLSNESRK